MTRTRFIGWLAGGGVLAVLLSGCFAVYEVGMRVLYDEARWPATRVVHDVAYRFDAEADPAKHRLNLFLPEGTGWPVVVFVHGGGWDAGDKDYTVARRDVYNNIGRYLAAHGVGAAVISYRLLPHVPWTAQPADVAAAVAWVHRHIGAYGGDPRRLFLMGHSAGAHLASLVALDDALQRRAGLPPRAVCGVVAVSGAGYDMTDERTFELGADRAYLTAHFGANDPTGDWPRAASSVTYISPDDPPFLILYGLKEAPAFGRQSEVLAAALQAAGVPVTVRRIPGQDHPRMVLALSRDDKGAGPATLSFVRQTPCPPAP